MRCSFVWLGIAIALPSYSFADEGLPLTPQSRPSAEIESPALHLLAAEVGLVAVGQAGKSTYSFILRYLPEYSLGGSVSHLSVGLGLGYSVFGAATGTNFSVIEYGAHATYRFDERWGVRLLVGAQTWTGDFNETAFLAGPELQYRMKSESGERSLFDHSHLFLAYTPVFQSNLAHELTAGIGVVF